MTLDEIILKAIPKESCAIQEGYNKNRRMLLKQRFNDYLADQLSKQFNAKSIGEHGLGESTNGRINVP